MILFFQESILVTYRKIRKIDEPEFRVLTDDDYFYDDIGHVDEENGMGHVVSSSHERIIERARRAPSPRPIGRGENDYELVNLREQPSRQNERQHFGNGGAPVLLNLGSSRRGPVSDIS